MDIVSRELNQEIGPIVRPSATRVRWPRRWHVGSLMIVVAVIGLVLGAVVGVFAERRRAYYRVRVESLAWGEAEVVERVAERLQAARRADERGPAGHEEAEIARLEAEWLAQVAAWHVRLERTYMRASERPFEPIPPDPPPPEPPAVLSGRISR